MTSPQSPAPDSAVLEVAIDICRAHHRQRNPSPGGDEPYVLHLLRVMLAVDGNEDRTAAVLHDVLEDTPTTATELLAVGVATRAVEAVVALTHRDEDTYEEYIEQVATNDLARAVKLAGLADNLATNRALPPGGANVARIARYEAAIARLAPGA
jgi:(p)ppGpp synthase/HD superfamily hydrolase